MISIESLRGLYGAPTTTARPEPATGPGAAVAVVTCMDARLRPESSLRLPRGSACVIRNAGGRVTDDVVRSLTIATTVLGVGEIVVIHHTDCGLTKVTNDQVRADINAAIGASTTIDFLPIADLRASVGSDVAAVRAAPLIPGDVPVSGFVCDVTTGRLELVDTDPLSRFRALAAQPGGAEPATRRG